MSAPGRYSWCHTAPIPVRLSMGLSFPSPFMPALHGPEYLPLEGDAPPSPQSRLPPRTPRHRNWSPMPGNRRKLPMPESSLPLTKSMARTDAPRSTCQTQYHWPAGDGMTHQSSNPFANSSGDARGGGSNPTSRLITSFIPFVRLEESKGTQKARSPHASTSSFRD